MTFPLLKTHVKNQQYSKIPKRCTEMSLTNTCLRLYVVLMIYSHLQNWNRKVKCICSQDVYKNVLIWIFIHASEYFTNFSWSKILQKRSIRLCIDVARVILFRGSVCFNWFLICGFSCGPVDSVMCTCNEIVAFTSIVEWLICFEVHFKWANQRFLANELLVQHFVLYTTYNPIDANSYVRRSTIRSIFDYILSSNDLCFRNP